jgi:hypothetical protein
LELVARKIDSVSLQVRWNKGGTKSAGLLDPGVDGRIILKWI